MLLALTLLVAPGLARPQESAPAAVPAINRAALAQSREDREREVDKQHLRVIYQAIQAYRQKHGDMPNWLSDLVPDFISDTNVLMSPVELRTGRSVLWGYGDPKVRSSYIYEFNQSDSGRKGGSGRCLDHEAMENAPDGGVWPSGPDAALPLTRSHSEPELFGGGL